MPFHNSLSLVQYVTRHMCPWSSIPLSEHVQSRRKARPYLCTVVTQYTDWHMDQYLTHTRQFKRVTNKLARYDRLAYLPHITA
jgi:hypothetical protein